MLTETQRESLKGMDFDPILGIFLLMVVLVMGLCVYSFTNIVSIKPETIEALVVSKETIPAMIGEVNFPEQIRLRFNILGHEVSYDGDPEIFRNVNPGQILVVEYRRGRFDGEAHELRVKAP